jgi:hypothetical protein
VGQGNYTGTATGSFAIEQRKLTIGAANTSKAYGADDPEFETEATGLVDGHSIDSVNFVRAAGEAAESEHAIYVMDAKIVDANGADVTANYAITYSAGTLTIGAAPVVAEIMKPSATFKGGSLRMPGTTTDTTATTSADLRFGYQINLPEGVTVQEAITAGRLKWSWSYGTNPNQLAYTKSGVNYSISEDGTVVSNLVFTDIPVADFAKTIYVRITVTYTADDGTIYTFNESDVTVGDGEDSTLQPNGRSVLDVLNKILETTPEDTTDEQLKAERDFAQSLINAYNER